MFLQLSIGNARIRRGFGAYAEPLPIFYKFCGWACHLAFSIAELGSGSVKLTHYPELGTLY
jgi:hypothetical protein